MPVAAGEHRSSYGYVVSAIDLDPEQWHGLPTFFGEVEAAGCDAILLTDHVLSGYPSAEPFVSAAVAVVSTSNCLIGTGVLQLPLRRSAVVAKSASTLQLVSGGRFRLGVGVGQHEEEFNRVGVDFRTRGRAADRSLRELAEHWRAPDTWFAQRPEAVVPIWVGGTTAPALRRVVEYGSGWLSLFQSPHRFAETNRLLDELLEVEERRADSVERRAMVVVCPTDLRWSRDDALSWASRLFPGGAAGIGRHVITGSVAECVEAMREFEESGADAIDLQIAHPDPLPKFAELCLALST